MTEGQARRPTGAGAGEPRASLAGKIELAMTVPIRLCLVVSCICLSAIILIGTGDTLGRIVGRPLLSSTEMTESLLATAIFLALPTVQRQRAHVVVDILKQSFGARMRYLGELSALLIGVLVMFLLARQGTMGAIAAAQSGEVAAGYFPIPIWLAKCASAVGLVIAATEAVRQLICLVIWPGSLPAAINPESAPSSEEH